MKYCSHCGKEIMDEAVICPSCGCKVASENTMTTEDKSVIILIIKIFMIIGCIATGWSLIPLLWTVPMTLHAFRKLDAHEPMTTAFKVCTLIFVNLIAGILLLCVDTTQDF